MTGFARLLLSTAGLAACLCGTALAEPLARVDGIENARLRADLAAALGEADGPAEDRWRARERAETAADRARAFLRSQGYYAARIDARLDADGRALIRVRTGERFLFDAVSVAFDQPDGAPEPVDAVRDALALSAGDPVTARSVLDARARLTAALQENGFPEAQTAEYAVTVDHAYTKADAVFTAPTGPFIRLGDGRFAGGLAELREDYIDRLAPYELGDPASVSALNAYAARLAALDAVAVADARLAPVDEEGPDGLRPVDVRAEPAPRHRLTGAVSWSTDEGAGARGSWARRNLFGGAERVTVSGQIAQLERLASVQFFAPHWAAYGQDLRLAAELAQERTDAFDQDVIRLDAELTRRFSRKWSASLGAGLQTGEITDAQGTRTLTTLTVPVGAVYDGRDDVLDPREGLYVDLEAVPGWSVGDADVRFVRTAAGARFYQALGSELTLALRAKTGAVWGASADSIPADLRFYAGGGGSVRGYGYQELTPLQVSPRTGALEPFGGRSLIEGSAELRWRRSERLGFAAFVDGGAAGPDIDPAFGEVRYGAGVGVRYYPGFGPIRLDIATPIDPRPQDDSFQLYISIGQAF
ncbi:MAG: BamA/TamA family outer membrane protein [Alphaproteobacteria bacterium]|nr:BamA/TamA family outer membrane protein [Alphaproteobacteria bacterium]